MPDIYTRYVIVYRTGGTHDCSWHRVLELWRREDDAKAAAFDLVMMGYKCLIKTADELETVGIPIGWDSNSVDPDKDDIVVSRYSTRHIRRH